MGSPVPASSSSGRPSCEVGAGVGSPHPLKRKELPRSQGSELWAHCLLSLCGLEDIPAEVRAKVALDPLGPACRFHHL